MKTKIGDLVYLATECWDFEHYTDSEPLTPGLVIAAKESGHSSFVRPVTVLWPNGCTDRLWHHDIVEVNHYLRQINTRTGYN
jgi:hypothetical protein